MKFILTSYVETPFVDAKNCSEEMKNTLCDSGKAFYNGTIIFTKQLCSTEAPPCTVLGISLSLQALPVCCCSWQRSVPAPRARPWGSSAGEQGWQQVTVLPLLPGLLALCLQRHHPGQAPSSAVTPALLGFRKRN